MGRLHLVPPSATISDWLKVHGNLLQSSRPLFSGFYWLVYLFFGKEKWNFLWSQQSFLWTKYIPTYAKLNFNKRISILALLITAIAGANLQGILSLWPLECQIFFGSSDLAIVQHVLPSGLGIIVGIVLVSWGLSGLHGGARELMTITTRYCSLKIEACVIWKESNS